MFSPEGLFTSLHISFVFNQ